jgi:LmbE family N-acetylglucosaminyl deacetylase
MIFYLIFFFLLIYLFLVYQRANRYKYNQREDYIYNLNKISKNEISDYDTIFLKVTLPFNPISYFLKPYIKIENQKHYFEYGAKGVRYINVSHTAIKNESTQLYGYKNSIKNSKKILILAPHADDAEIAAFGLYKNTHDVTIVTTTMGENGICNYCDIYNNDKTKQAFKKAELRVLDALSIPLLGNIEVTKCLTLGYFGSTLQWMSQNREKKASSEIKDITDMNQFRKVSHSNIVLPLKVEPTYNSFFNDLKSVIEQGEYDIIITPHPSIDSHPDHKYTTLTLIDVLQKSNSKADLLLYTNHLKLSETYPIGEMNSSITLPPNRENFYFDSIFSFGLDKDLQIDKFFALEAIHDLRDSLIQISIKRAYKHFSRLLRRKLAGKDKSYYKRAIRANELFFVVKNKNINKLIDV